MPTYEYRCPECGVFEFQQKITADPLDFCPDCGQAVTRLISKNVGIVYKAGGFYSTDNRQTAAKDNSKETTKTAGEESKPAAAPSGKESA